MGDDIELKKVEVIQGGTLQIDLWNNTKNHGIRFFCLPDQILEAIAVGMKQATKDWINQNMK